MRFKYPPSGIKGGGDSASSQDATRSVKARETDYEPATRYEFRSISTVNVEKGKQSPWSRTFTF